LPGDACWLVSELVEGTAAPAAAAMSGATRIADTKNAAANERDVRMTIFLVTVLLTTVSDTWRSASAAGFAPFRLV